jgi:hypothetical protein
MKWFMFALLLAAVHSQDTDEFVDYQDDDYDMLENVEPFTEVVEEFIDEANEAVYQEFPQDDSVFDSDKNKFVSPILTNSLIKELQKFPCGCTCKQTGGDLVYW